MRYCPDCGTGHECEAQAATMRDDPAVLIARIQADRDVTLAKLGNRQEAAWNESREAIAETEAETAVDVAIAEAVVADTILGAELAGATEEPEPIVIDAPPVNVEQDVDVEELPPVEGTPAPESARKPRGLGMW
jgi:hypothetical protein